MSTMIKQVEEQKARIETFVEMYYALKILYWENVDYIRINNLGDPHHNESMKKARDVLAKIERESI